MIAYLMTAREEFVVRLQVPPFNEPPQVIGWGDRVFVHAGELKNGEEMYRECFSWAAPPGVELRR